MQRVFTEDVGENFSAGDVRDYPITTWRHIAGNVGKSLDDFTAPFTEAAQAVISARHNKKK